MCTVVILRRPDHPWPLLVAANRDEMRDRPWRPPARHWPERPEVRAGLDELGGGTWLGMNDMGVAAGILNRYGTLGPQAGKRSRGELVLEALDHADAADAAEALLHLDGRAYRAFNMLVADNRDAFWVRHAGGARIEVHPIPEGLHMLTAFELDDPEDPRILAFRPRFQAAPVPEPETGDWLAWQELLATPAADRGESGLLIAREDGFGTSSSSLLALPAVERLGEPPVWLFKSVAEDQPYAPVEA